LSGNTLINYRINESDGSQNSYIETDLIGIKNISLLIIL